MAFTSVSFLFYFLPLALVLYVVFSFSRSLQNLLLVLMGFLFYAWGEPLYSTLLVGVILLNYVIGLLMYYTRNMPNVIKAWLVLGVSSNLGVLIWMKYMPFLTENLSQATAGRVPVLSWILPAGISFYVFSGISYLVDVYRQEAQAEKNLISLSLYFNFFPKLMQGPIARYADFSPQLFKRELTFTKFTNGVTRFMTGFSKKILLANQMGIVADRIFALNQMEEMSWALAWLGMIAYTFQIYYDFSGYSDMAIGLANLLGFNLPENFNYPYISRSISEFWRRWHISLGEWFKNYLYFPLGGSRTKNQDKVLRNLAFVWLATGFWHGAEWTFLVWGLWNFLFIALERVFEFEKKQLRNSFRHAYTMFVVMLGWVIFRSASIVEAGSYLSKLFNVFTQPLMNDYLWMFLREFGIFFIFAFIFCVPIAPMVNEWMSQGITVRQRFSLSHFVENHRIVESVHFKTVLHVLYPLTMMILFLVSVMYLVNGTYNSFIYFNF